ncbi:hypothetical protein CDAR_399601 [Caerostris darwini]|uniref:Uncharacterized protein n=1 Tax=Caerostris darwini TaxID=1538125 RepID=A0AAV4RPR3_9ARAC|nr:hypothetical protein CDAR_399601 [Caerostris darwini]
MSDLRRRRAEWERRNYGDGHAATASLRRPSASDFLPGAPLSTTKAAIEGCGSTPSRILASHLATNTNH